MCREEGVRWNGEGTLQKTGGWKGEEVERVASIGEGDRRRVDGWSDGRGEREGEINRER